jgi:hypothetical protein
MVIYNKHKMEKNMKQIMDDKLILHNHLMDHFYRLMIMKYKEKWKQLILYKIFK